MDFSKENLTLSSSSMNPSTSRGTLHNFTFLPSFNLKWGRQRQLRCVKHHSLTRSESNSDDSHRQRQRQRRSNDGIQAMREKLMIDFRRQVDLIHADFLMKSDVVATPEVHSPTMAAAEESAAAVDRPWNLRTRRAVCKDPSERKPCFSPMEIKSPAKRYGGDIGGVNGGGNDGDRRRRSFSVAISKREIEEDFIAILGTRPARRPKKRPKIIQRQIDAIFPGFWLSEITVDKYKVD